MPEYNPKTHEPIIINLYEQGFVRAYTDIDSPTWANAYKSAIVAGYSPTYARVILGHFPKWKIKKTLENMQNPLSKLAIKQLSSEDSRIYTPSKRELKRRQIEENKHSKAVLEACREEFGDLE